MPTNNPLAEIFHHLQSTGFEDLAGSRFSGTIPVSERMINEVIAAAIPPGGHVREVQVRPEQDNRFSVRITPRTGFFPSITVKLSIARQPELPASPVLVLKMAMGGLMGFASSALPIANMLPPGVRLEGEHILVDLRAMASQRGFANLFQYVRQLRVTTESGQAVVSLEAAI